MIHPWKRGVTATASAIPCSMAIESNSSAPSATVWGSSSIRTKIYGSGFHAMSPRSLGGMKRLWRLGEKRAGGAPARPAVAASGSAGCVVRNVVPRVRHRVYYVKPGCLKRLIAFNSSCTQRFHATSMHKCPKPGPLAPKSTAKSHPQGSLPYIFAGLMPLPQQAPAILISRVSVSPLPKPKLLTSPAPLVSVSGHTVGVALLRRQRSSPGRAWAKPSPRRLCPEQDRVRQTSWRYPCYLKAPFSIASRGAPCT